MIHKILRNYCVFDSTNSASDFQARILPPAPQFNNAGMVFIAFADCVVNMGSNLLLGLQWLLFWTTTI